MKRAAHRPAELVDIHPVGNHRSHAAATSLWIRWRLQQCIPEAAPETEPGDVAAFDFRSILRSGYDVGSCWIICTNEL
jgi:hypothetical protein